MISYQLESLLLMRTCNYFGIFIIQYRAVIEKIPCATLLIRVAKAPMEGTKVLGLQVTPM